jgi:sulfonate transport system permease protein
VTMAEVEQAADLRLRLRREPGAPERDPRRYSRRSRAVELALAIGTPLLLIVLWQVASSQEWIDRRLYPAPSDIVAQARLMYDERGMWDHTWASIRRILFGFLWGSVAGISIGILMGVSRHTRAAFDSLLSALYTVPKLAILPIFLIILGFDETPIIAIIAITVFFFVWISTMSAVTSIPETYRDVGRSFSASRWQTFRHILLPASLPQIFVGLRIAAGVAVLTLVGVEFVFPGSPSRGVGYVINQGRQLNLPKQAYAGIVIVAVIGVVFIAIVRMVGRLVAPWAPRDRGAGLM